MRTPNKFAGCSITVRQRERFRTFHDFLIRLQLVPPGFGLVLRPRTLVVETASQGRRSPGRERRRSRSYVEDEDAAIDVPGRRQPAERLWSEH